MFPLRPADAPPRGMSCLDAHGARQVPPRTCTVAEAGRQRPVERLPLEHLERVAGDPTRSPRYRSIAGSLSDMRTNLPALPGFRSDMPAWVLLDRQLQRGAGDSDCRAVRASDCRAWPRSAPRAPPRSDARAPRPPRGRDPRARRGARPGTSRAGGGGGSPRARPLVRRASAHALVADVAHQAALVELLDHRRDRRGRHAQPLGERVLVAVPSPWRESE